jgi:hypothetical protein
MLQAHAGDLLRIVTRTESVIVDAGPPSCRDTLADLLGGQQRCRLLVLTHLDEDHYGGLRALMQATMDGRAPAGMRWPERIWVNDFEPRGTLNALVDGIEDDGAPNELLRVAVDAANAWRQRNPLEVVRAGDRREDDAAERHLDDARIHVAVGPDTFEYLLRRVEAVEGEVPVDDLDAAMRSALELVALALDLAAHASGERIDLRTRLAEVLRRFEALAARREPHARTAAHELRFRDTVVTGRSRAGVRVRTADQALADQLRAGDDLRRHMPPEVGGLLHLARDGPVLLEELRRDHEFLTLSDALRALPGVVVESATAGRTDRPLRTNLRLDVLGPGAKDLAELRRSWRRIREKGRLHVRRAHLAFLEASLFDASHEHYALDRSVTNRSSIQVLASTSSGYAVLTGDGRPDTLIEGLQRVGVPPTPCVAFKAAHHGSSHNIALDEDPNLTFAMLKPRAVWISGSGHHPTAAFIDYLRQQRGHLAFEVVATNLNDALRTIDGVTMAPNGVVSTPL